MGQVSPAELEKVLTLNLEGMVFLGAEEIAVVDAIEMAIDVEGSHGERASLSSLPSSVVILHQC